jgi:HEAT repeat protein
MPASSDGGATRLIALALLVALAATAARAAADTPPAPHGGRAAKPADDSGKPAGARPAGPIGRERLETWRLALLARDEGAAADAAAALGATGSAAAREPLLEVLAAGGSPDRLAAILDALVKLGEAHALGAGETTIDLLELYAGHRSPDIRRRAVQALGTISESRVVPVLLDRLGDAAPDVRAAAAVALGARHEAKAAARLFALVRLGDAGAAQPLAAVATPDLIPRIAELGGTVDDGIVATTLGDYVKRRDLPDTQRVDVLRTLARLPGAEATTALVEYVASVGAKDDRPSKREAQKLIDTRETNP